MPEPLPARLALVYEHPPPYPSAGSVILNHVLGDVPAEDYCVLSSLDLHDEDEDGALPGSYDRTPRLPGRYFRLPRRRARLSPVWHHPLPATDAYRLPIRFLTVRQRHVPDYSLAEGSRLDALGTVADVYRRARMIAAVIRERRCEVLLAIGDPQALNLPAAYFAGRWTGVPLVLWFWDPWTAILRTSDRHVGRWTERSLVRAAVRVIVLNEFLADHYRAYGIDPVVIHNAYALDDTSAPRPRDRPAGAETRILFAGYVYYYNVEVFLALLRAFEGLGTPAHLEVLSPLAPEALAGLGIGGPHVRCRYVAHTTLAVEYEAADVLFLPIAPAPPLGFRDVVYTALPGKLAEYLSSGRPILAVAPSGSFVDRYLTTNDCALVVHDDDPATLQRALRQLLDDSGLRARLTSNALRAARRDFDSATVREQFRRVIAEAAGHLR